MSFGIRGRFAVWLLAALLPVGVIATYVFGQIRSDVSERVEADLEGLVQLEVTRLENALDLYVTHAENLASGVELRTAATQVSEVELVSVKAGEPLPLQAVANDLQAKVSVTTREITGLQIRSVDGAVLGSTAGFDWEPPAADAVTQAVKTEAVVIGNAFRDSDGGHRIGMIAPVRSVTDDSVVAVVLLEKQLGPIVNLVSAHEVFGATHEAHILQRTGSGAGELITMLRFDRSAAFATSMPQAAMGPLATAFESPEATVVHGLDYRGEDAIFAIKTLPSTGWGIVVKVDRSEALAPLSHTRSLQGVAALGVIGVMFGWAAFLDPVARRLRSLAQGAERVASGDLETPLNDQATDEIGSVAQTIDRLATDLAADRAVRADVEHRLRYEASHDATTGLYNRQYATELMQRFVDAGDHEEISILFMDLDDFKMINDVYGHSAGDHVLAMVAKRLLAVVGTAGTVARWGGDEFVVVLAGASESAASEVVARIEQAFTKPIRTEAALHEVRASIGSSTLRSGDSVERMLQSADEAMFIDKQSRSGRRSVSPESVRAVETALTGDAIEVWYQPLVQGSDSSVTLQGAEALVRLRDASGSVVGPTSFLEDIAHSQVGRALDRRVIELSTRQIGQWIDTGKLTRDFQLSINCCESTIRDLETPAFVQRCMTAAGLEPHNLMIEISEKSSVLQPSVIAALRTQGIKVAVDDLGLNNRNIDRLLVGGASVAKIDGRWLNTDPNDEGGANVTVLRHLVALCDSLGLAVVAEGVETQQQLDVIQALGVSQFQGYFFARPLSGVDFADRFFSARQVAPQ